MEEELSPWNPDNPKPLSSTNIRIDLSITNNKSNEDEPVSVTAIFHCDYCNTTFQETRVSSKVGDKYENATQVLRNMKTGTFSTHYNCYVNNGNKRTVRFIKVVK